MKKIIMVALSLIVAFSCTFSIAPTDSADAKVKTYANCKELNKDYKGGKTNYKPYVSKAL